MKMTIFAVFALLTLSSAVAVEKDRTITQVVKLLQDMLDKSVKEGDEERVIYAKFKCYCDQSEAEKDASIKEMTETIALLESSIAETQGDTGGLSSDCADLKAAMADNKAAREEATTLRKKENKDFEAEEADLEQAIGQMKNAIETLSAVGADQTKSTGADNKQFMAGFKGASSLLQAQQSRVQVALKAASTFMTPAQNAKATSFLQAPFTGTYSSQSAQVMGIIKSMRDTFTKNLADARTTEKNSEEAYDKFMDLKNAAHQEMKDSYEAKQKELGGNDGSLADQKSKLNEANKQKASDEAFLAELLPLCADKAKGFQTRKLLRANEESAIAEAISILNSDDAFASFGKTDATSTGSKGGLMFIQVHAAGDAKDRRMVQKVLMDAKSARLAKVVSLLQGENAFDEVLGEIDKMIEVIGEEGKADKEKLDWCNDERKTNKKLVKDKKADMLSLKESIDKLTSDINDPKKGLKAMIQETEEKLVQNREAQTTETAERLQENAAYQTDVKNLVKAESILTRAMKVLSKYYDDLAAKVEAGQVGLIQEDPTPPAAWKGDGDYSGQSDQGNGVISMLEFIHEETVKEETTAHEDEEKSQAEYEDSMTKLKNEQAAGEKSLSKLQDDLATAEQDKLNAEESLKDTTADKEAAEDYLLKIKPGCDFITENFKLRNTNRATEKKALEKAVGLIKATPAYKTAVNSATVESYGDCKKPCVADTADVKCKACMADVTIPAYCAGHEGTKGC